MLLRLKRLWLVLLGAAWTGLALGAPLPTPTSAQLEFFEKRIRPLLANECYECHGSKKQKGGLRLDSRDALKKGGDSGPALIPGDSKKSLLLQAIRHLDEDSKMPKDRPKLSDAVIADFVAWVDAGAADPRDQPAEEVISANPANSWETLFKARRDWWSFKPLHQPSLPKTKRTDWSVHPVDRFLLAGMEAQQLVPAGPADRRTLIRRVNFLLTGLPPTPEEVRDFVEDSSTNAYRKVVDRLLDSPRFGEHWARHWMDLVRFAETHGSESDPDIPNAWRYRDYLIRVFNADIPWNQLIREHLAGDLLAKPRWQDGINESLQGVAHLRLVEHGFNPVDTLDEQVKTVDSQIDVVSKAFQGLTISCARCHDHKFDPISQRDYYALYGILASVRPTQLTIDDPARLRIHRDKLESLKVAIKKGLAAAWETSARQLGKQLREQNGELLIMEKIPGDEIREKIQLLERQIAALDEAGRVAALKNRGSTISTGATVTPLAAWTFNEDARDAFGDLKGELQGGAVIRNGRLVLDGKGAFLRTAALSQPLAGKTLEIWAVPANLEQRGSGLLTVESRDGSVFDSIVFAEKEPKKWTVGSDFYRRSQNLKGPDENSPPGTIIHLAIVYRTNDQVAFYRNGVIYGAEYKPTGENAGLRTFAAKESRVLIGMRHTGGGNPFFAGEIEEARLYGRALSEAEVQRSFQAGPGLVSPAEISLALSVEQKAERAALEKELTVLRSAWQKDFPNYPAEDAVRQRRQAALSAALKKENHPLNLWQRWKNAGPEKFSEEWIARKEKESREGADRKAFNTTNFSTWVDFAEPNPAWFRYGANPPETLKRPGEFSVEPDGERILTGLLPSGLLSHRLSQKHNGVFASPRFRITNDSISLRVVGGKGARVRIIPDHYPIGQGNIYPQANLNSDAPTWIRLDTAYRKGSMAYLEFATAEEVTSRDRSPAGIGGRSFFGVERLVFHEGKKIPRDEIGPLSQLSKTSKPPTRSEELSTWLVEEMVRTIQAWSDGSLDESGRSFLDSFVREGLLPVNRAELPEVAKLVDDYRKLESEIPVPRRIPGVLEGDSFHAPLLVRGDHLQPGENVPRRYLELMGSGSFRTAQSGRLELAEELVSPNNPLTSRVMVNRIWLHVFGRGLVGTVDNFGRLGEKPSHPELMDYLAKRWVEEGWSLKTMLRTLLETRAFQMSSESSSRAREMDPANQWLSHMPVRRLAAESIRDNLLAVSGRLENSMYGPGANALAPPPEQRRRSVYLTIRRNFLSPFLETFDAPRPFSTLGKREITNVPAQSLALLNDPLVIELAGQCAQRVIREEKENAPRLDRLFEIVLSRPPTSEEQSKSSEYLEELRRGQSDEKKAWQDLAQSLFNLKEFIYLR